MEQKESPRPATADEIADHPALKPTSQVALAWCKPCNIYGLAWNGQ